MTIDRYAVMDVNKLFTIRNVPSTDRSLLSTSLLFSSEVYHKVPCNLFFEKICVVYNSAEIANDATFIAGDFFDAETKELYKLWKPAKLLGTEEVPKAGMSLRKLYQPREEENSADTLSSSTSNSESEEKEYRPPSKKKKRKLENERKEKKSKKAAKNENEERPRPKKPEKEEQVIKFVNDINEQKQEKTTKKSAGDIQSKVGDFYSDLETKEVVLGGVVGDMEYSWLSVGTAKAAVGDCVFVRLTEGIQLGRIISIHKEHKNGTDPVRLKLYRIYLEEEMFVTKRESATIHVNEAFATDFVIHALACQVDETVDVVYLKKKEKIPPQNEIPKGRLFIRRYYHPLRHLLRSLAEPLDSADLSIIPQPHPPINGHNEEDMNLNRKPCIPDGWSGTVRYSDHEKESDSRDVVATSEVSTSELIQSSANESGSESEKVTVAVLEPKSVLSQPSDSTELPFSGLSDLAEQSSSDPAVNATSVVDDTEPTTNITISIVSESDINSETSMMILPSNMISFTVSNDQAVQQNSDQQTIQIVPSTTTNQQTIQIVPSIAGEPNVISSNQPETTPATDQKSVAIVPSSQLNTIEIVPQAMSGTNQIQIMTGDSNQVQVIDSSSIQIVPSTDTTSSSSSPFLPTIISSEQDMHTDMDVDITHAADGCITIAPVTTKRNNTAKFEDSYTKNGRVYFRKCHFKDETIVQGEAVYVRCNDQNPNSEDESWKLGRVMEFYHASYPVVRLLWFYVEEEMVTSKNERASIHPQEVFASQCDDEVEISSIESKANVIYLKKGETIPKVSPETNLFCRRFYDPYKHSIKALKNRLSATDVSILPEPMVATKRGRSSTTSTPLEATTPNTKRKKTSPSKQGATPRKQSPRKIQTAKTPLQTAKTPLQTAETPFQTANPPRQMPFFSPQVKNKVTESLVCEPDKATETSNTADNKDKPRLFFASTEETVEGSKNDEAVSNKVEMGLEVPIVSSVIEKSDSTESMISIIQAESTIPTIQAESTNPTIQAESTNPTIQAESTIPTIQAESTNPTIQAEPTIPTIQAESTIPTIQAESTNPTIQAEPTIPTIQAESTNPIIQAESTIPTIQAESTIPTIQAESTIPTIQAESTIQIIPADIPDHSKIAAKDNDHYDIVALDIPVVPEKPSEELKECDSVTEKVEIEVSSVIQLSADLTENPQNIDPEQTTLSSSHEQPLAMLSDPPSVQNQFSLEEMGSETGTTETETETETPETETETETPETKLVQLPSSNTELYDSKEVEHADEIVQVVPQIKNAESFVTKQVVSQTSNTELHEVKNAVDPASVENVEKENVDSDSCVTL
ncbi:mucin-2-like [Bolinopsis microptera]|uniref:mucin-2-like n=1 Tax=Bolinopsis microptera TaxID=2820187 RepID=UPI00307936F4